jgi:tetratricopeptide (TPR) repeat protein
MGAAYIQQGNIDRGLQCCEEALAFGPILARDTALTKAVRGYGQIKAGRFDSGIADLSDALGWLDRADFRFTYLAFALWLAEGYLRMAHAAKAHPLIQDILDTSETKGYIHIEGRAHWLMGDCLAVEGLPAAEDHIATAMRILENVGARNDLAKAMVSRAALRQRAGDAAAARQLLARALALFRELRTLDESARVEAALATLDRGSPIPLLGAAA